MSIALEGLTKTYGDQAVVNNVSLEVADGEFFVLLGSSGSGKTTILNLIAGLTDLDRGRIMLHGRDVTQLPTQKRRVGFVFQNYALFRYMTVAENVEFALRIRKTPAVERRRRRDEMLDLVGLAGMGDRMPAHLSGGQQQRVALARALAYEPDVLLLDEPLGALDAKIRAGLRRSLHQIQRSLGIAAILVTHDQEEAFDLADRIGVMSYGRLIEVGSPADLYQRPKTEFVATFLGAANLMVGCATGGGFQLGPRRLDSVNGNGAAARAEIAAGRRVQLLVRPEDVSLAPDESSLGCASLGPGEVESVSFGGAFERLRLRLPPMEGVRTIAPAAAYGEKHLLIDSIRAPESARQAPLRPGDRVWVGVRRFHALEHPGLRFMVLVDGSEQGEAALELGGQMARLAHARLTLLGLEARGQDPVCMEGARKRVESGTAALDSFSLPGSPGQAIAAATNQEPHDLVIIGHNPRDLAQSLREILRGGEQHHLLLVPGPTPVPARALVCVAGGEPGKDDVLFTGRLARHFGTEATLMTVVNEAVREAWNLDRTAHFLDDGVRSLENMGVPARALVQHGRPEEAIEAEFKSGGYDLLVLGAPLIGRRGGVQPGNLVSRIMDSLPASPVLIVRSPITGQFAGAGAPSRRDLAGAR